MDIKQVAEAGGSAETAVANQIIIEKVDVITNAHGKQFYSAIDRQGVERAPEMPKITLERAYGAAKGVLEWKEKSVVFFNPRTSKWVRCKTVAEAEAALAPKEAKETKKKAEKPKVPTAEELAQAKADMLANANAEAAADPAPEAIADTNAEGKGNDKPSGKGGKR